MGDLVPLVDPENYKQVKDRIKKLWREGYVEIRPHAQARMKERDLDVNDLQYLIRFGRIAEHSRPRTQWRYKIVGTSVDNVAAACVVEINGRLIIVTVMVAKRR